MSSSCKAAGRSTTYQTSKSKISGIIKHLLKLSGRCARLIPRRSCSRSQKFIAGSQCTITERLFQAQDRSDTVDDVKDHSFADMLDADMLDADKKDLELHQLDADVVVQSHLDESDDDK